MCIVKNNRIGRTTGADRFKATELPTCRTSRALKLGCVVFEQTTISR